MPSIQHFLMAGLVTIAVFIVMMGMAVQVEREWGVSDAVIYNTTGTAALQSALSQDYFDSQVEYITNTSQLAPGMSGAEIPDTSTTSSPSLISSFTSIIGFIWQARTLPTTVILALSGFLHINPLWILLVIIGITMYIIFKIISMPFFNKP